MEVFLLQEKDFHCQEDPDSLQPQDLLDNGSLSAAREKGIVGMEGKDYVVKDGDVILFRFNV